MRSWFKERSANNTMKVIPLSEAKTNLPAFELVRLDEDDDLIDQLLEHNPRFRQLLQSRLKEKTVSVTEALKKLQRT